MCCVGFSVDGGIRGGVGVYSKYGVFAYESTSNTIVPTPCTVPYPVRYVQYCRKTQGGGDTGPDRNAGRDEREEQQQDAEPAQTTPNAHSARTQSQPKRPPTPTAHRLPQGGPALASRKHPQPLTGQRTSPACPPDDSINARPHKARSSAPAPLVHVPVLLPDRHRLREEWANGATTPLPLPAIRPAWPMHSSLERRRHA